MLNNVIERVKAIAAENPYGFTLSVPTCEPILFGIVVAHLDTQDSFGDEGLLECLVHALENDKVLGGWKNEDGTMQYDSCKVFTSLSEALAFAKENNQRAIFNLTTLEEIKL